MNNFLIWSEAAIVLAMVAMALLVLRGLLPISVRWKERDAVWHFATGLLLIVGAISMRSFYWAYFPMEIQKEIGKSIPNIFFGLIALMGGFLILKLQWLIIPDIDRPEYTIWNAPWYPRDTNWRMGIIFRFFRKRKKNQ